MRIVVALGGNALLRRGEPMTVEAQRANVAAAAAALVPLLAEHQVVITHGNGPQVGLLALQNEASAEVPAYPLDVLDAETEGMIGYLLESELGSHGFADRLASVLTQVVVDADDPAFGEPHKFVGPVYDETTAHDVAATRSWTVARDGDGWRRVVASPEPQRIVELGAIQTLLDNGYVVICAGGGGIPVVERDGHFVGAEAVVDKDLASARLALDLEADALVLLTDVDGVYDGWGAPGAHRVDRADPEHLRALILPSGSMGPKVEAACRFVDRRGGSIAAIGALSDAFALAHGQGGTQVVSDQEHPAIPASGDDGAIRSIPECLRPAVIT